MKIVAIGDIHGRPHWKQIWQEQSDADKIVFVGDYFDSYDVETEKPIYSAAEQLFNFNEIIELKKLFPNKFVLLIGNHDAHYFPGMRGQTAGFQEKHATFIQMALEENKHLLQAAYATDRYLFSHAGITANWLNDVYGKDGYDIGKLDEAVNEMWNYKPRAFMFNVMCWNKYGDDPEQSPMWVRPRSLLRGAQLFKKRWIQIVGHTVQDKIDLKGKSTGCRYYFIDTLETSGEYLIINHDHTITTKKYNNES